VCRVHSLKDNDVIPTEINQDILALYHLLLA